MPLYKIQKNLCAENVIVGKATYGESGTTYVPAFLRGERSELKHVCIPIMIEKLQKRGGMKLENC